MNKVFCIKYLKIDDYRIFNPGDICIIEESHKNDVFIYIKGHNEESKPYYGYRFDGKFDEYFCDYKSPKARAIKLRKIN
jgi:hypothetical protein